jgi:N-acetylmuramoyl-L-alanine amidase
MKIIAVDMGHCLSGADTSASGIVVESTKDREIGKLVIQKINSIPDYKAINCTVDSANSVSDSLAQRVNTANNAGCDFYISIHLDSGEESAHGTTVLIQARGGQAEEVGNKVLNNMVDLGYYNRGVQVAKDYLGYNLYVLKTTNMSAILVECGFCTSQVDCNLFDADKIANAIVKGITGQIAPIQASQPIVNKQTVSNNQVSNNDNGGFKEMNAIYKNGSTPEPCFADFNLTNKIGQLNPWETAVAIGEFQGKIIILYNGVNCKKVAFVNYRGGL